MEEIKMQYSLSPDNYGSSLRDLFTGESNNDDYEESEEEIFLNGQYAGGDYNSHDEFGWADAVGAVANTVGKFGGTSKKAKEYNLKQQKISAQQQEDQNKQQLLLAKEASKQKKSQTKMYILIFVAVVVLSVLGYLGYRIFKK